MSLASGSKRDLLYVKETTFGETPTTPDMTKIRSTGDSLNLTKQTSESEELRADRAVVDVRHGNKQVGGDINIELSYGTFDDFILAVLGASSWAEAYNLTGLTLSIDATGKTVTDDGAGDFEALGVEVGDPITLSGFANSENNDTFEVTAVSGDTITIGNATGLVSESGATGCAILSGREEARVGNTLDTFSIEKGFSDISQYMVYDGVGFSSLSLSLQPNAMVTGSFSIVGSGQTINGSTLDATPTAPPTGSPFDGFDGSIKEGGSAISIVASLDISIDNSLAPLFVLMSDEAKQLEVGRSRINGTLTAYFENLDLYNKFINETESSLVVTLNDLDGNSYRVTLPRVKFNSGDLPVNAEGSITMSVSYQALYDESESTNIIWERIPAVS